MRRPWAWYRISGRSVPMRDRDKTNCQECGTELKSWNGGVVYRAEFIAGTSAANETLRRDDLGTPGATQS